MNKRYEWSESDIAYLREHYPHEPVTDIADYLHVSPPVVSRKVKELGLVKSSDYDRRSLLHRYVRNYTHNATKYLNMNKD